MSLSLCLFSHTHTHTPLSCVPNEAIALFQIRDIPTFLDQPLQHFLLIKDSNKVTLFGTIFPLQYAKK